MLAHGRRRRKGKGDANFFRLRWYAAVALSQGKVCVPIFRYDPAMILRQAAALTCLLAIAPGLTFAQAPDAAAERARLANERIQAEAERRAREEQEQQNRAAAPAAPEPAPASAPSRAPAGPAAPTHPATAADLTERGLEQLRELARMKDAGYLTDAEFQRIKQKILDSHF